MDEFVDKVVDKWWVQLGVLVTSICNLKCPECCYRIPTHETLAPKHYDWAMFERAAEAFRGLDVLYVSGGEPTLHPEFPRIAREFRNMFCAKEVMLVTNGFKLLEHKTLIEHFDYIRMTDFDNPDTQASVRWMRETHPDKLMLAPVVHTPFCIPGRGGRCGKYGLMACADDKVWPCCIGPGLKDAPSMPVSPRCRSMLWVLGAPCDTCCFSG